MRRSAAVLLVVCLSLVPATLVWASTNFAANAGKFDPKPLVPADPAFPLGERLTYDIFWLGFRVGVGDIWVKEREVIDGRDAFHVVATARGNGFLAKLYPVNDEIHSWIDARTLESLRFSKKIAERATRKDEEQTYDAARGKGVHVSRITGERVEFDVKAPVRDVVSAFYWLRRQPLEPGRTFRTPITVDRADWELSADVVAHKVESLRGQGVVDAIVVEPKRILKGVEDKKGRAWVYLRNDARRTPVYVKVQSPFGAVVGVLRSPRGENGASRRR